MQQIHALFLFRYIVVPLNLSLYKIEWTKRTNKKITDVSKISIYSLTNFFNSTVRKSISTPSNFNGFVIALVLCLVAMNESYKKQRCRCQRFSLSVMFFLSPRKKRHLGVKRKQTANSHLLQIGNFFVGNLIKKCK